jgi:hypothetical protein
LVTPSPTLLFPFGYAVARRDSNLLLYFNTWLLNAEGDGTIDELYRYWMLGEVKQTLPPRWSIIRNASSAAIRMASACTLRSRGRPGLVISVASITAMKTVRRQNVQIYWYLRSADRNL